MVVGASSLRWKSSYRSRVGFYAGLNTAANSKKEDCRGDHSHGGPNSGTEDRCVRFSPSYTAEVCHGLTSDDQHPHDTAVGNGPKGRLTGFGYEVRIAGSADNSWNGLGIGQIADGIPARSHPRYWGPADDGCGQTQKHHRIGHGTPGEPETIVKIVNDSRSEWMPIPAARNIHHERGVMPRVADSMYAETAIMHVIQPASAYARNGTSAHRTRATSGSCFHRRILAAKEIGPIDVATRPV